VKACSANANADESKHRCSYASKSNLWGEPGADKAAEASATRPILDNGSGDGDVGGERNVQAEIKV
jgi:hypothetical protein